MTYKVIVEDVVNRSYEITVDAKDRVDAECKVSNMYHDGELYHNMKALEGTEELVDVYVPNCRRE